jgi:hypothetical protein
MMKTSGIRLLLLDVTYNGTVHDLRSRALLLISG